MSDQYSDEAMLRTTAALRAQHTAEARRRDGVPTDEPRATDMTIGDALAEIAMTFESDGFWADLGQPILMARTAMEEGTDEARRRAAAHLTELRDQIVALKDIFRAEQQILEVVIDMLSRVAPQEHVTLATVLPGVRTTRSPEDLAAAKRKGHEKNERQLKKLTEGLPQADGPEAGEPWHFKETKNECQMTVTVAVPAETKAKDCDVSIQRSTLRVAVRGHERQPCVIDGELVGAVDPESCGWTLDGSGEKRHLAIELEKKMGGFMWERLLKAP
mmetsp:Transcript_101696/g.286717  ORF Transcript_101696/g.286717 Transcript_101696/m.286717 type:complete len:274 (-) Transcript_101696:95-916(-)